MNQNVVFAAGRIKDGFITLNYTSNGVVYSVTKPLDRKPVTTPQVDEVKENKLIVEHNFIEIPDFMVERSKKMQMERLNQEKVPTKGVVYKFPNRKRISNF